MKAAYVKAPFEIVVKEAPRRALTDTEVRLDIHACGVGDIFCPLGKMFRCAARGGTF